MISPKKTIPLKLTRTISFGEDLVSFKDEISRGSDHLQLKYLKATSSISMHSPSAKQDRLRMLAQEDEAAKEWANIINQGGTISIYWKCQDGNIIFEQANR